MEEQGEKRMRGQQQRVLRRVLWMQGEGHYLVDCMSGALVAWNNATGWTTCCKINRS